MSPDPFVYFMINDTLEDFLNAVQDKAYSALGSSSRIRIRKCDSKVLMTVRVPPMVDGVWDFFSDMLKVAARFDLDAESVCDLLKSRASKITVVFSEMPPGWLEKDPARVFLTDQG